MKAAIYLRVSTDKQTEVNQEPDCLRICQQRGWEPILFREQESAVKKRPEWERVKTAAHRGEVEAVVVWALDRAGRDRVRLAHDLGEFGRRNVTVVSVKEAWLDQPAGPLRDLLIQIMAWFAQAERDRLIERTKAGMDRARKLGKPIGRPRVALDLERARALFAERRSYGAVARILGCSRATLKKALPGVSKRGPWGRVVKA